MLSQENWINSLRKMPLLLAGIVSCTLNGASTVPVQAAEAKPSNAAIKIGFVTSLTGVGASDGPLMVNGFKLYLEQHNNKMNGKPVELFVEDDKGAVNTAIAACRKLTEKDKVDIVSGFIYAPLVYACSPFMEKEKTPFNVCVSGADDISQRKRQKWVFRTGWTSSQIAQPMAYYAAKKLGYKKVVTVCSDYAHPHEVVGAFQKVFSDNGGTVVQRIFLPMDTTEYTEKLKQINTQADAIFLCLVGKSSRVVPKQLNSLGIKLPIIATSTTFEENVLPEVGSDVLGAISTEPYSAALDRKQNKQFVAAYKAKYGSVPCFYSECGYTSAEWIDKAVTAMNGDVSDKERFLTALKHVECPDDPRGPLKLDPYGALVQNIYVRKVRSVNGQFENTVIDIYPLCSQFWKSDPTEFLKHPVFSKEYPPFQEPKAQ